MATIRLHRGKWIADFRDQTGHRRLEAPKGPFSSKALEKRAAQELLAQRLEEVRQKTYRSFGEKPAFSRLADLFLGSKVRARKTTIDGYRELIDCYLRPYFGSRKVDEITSFEIEQFRDEMAVGVPARVQRARELRERELKDKNPKTRLQPLRPGPRTTNKCLTLLVGIMGYGCRHKFVSGNPALKIEKLKEAEGEARVIEENVLTP
jgi:Phage integrase, N-terminal SAM-like domain